LLLTVLIIVYTSLFFTGFKVILSYYYSRYTLKMS